VPLDWASRAGAPIIAASENRSALRIVKLLSGKNLREEVGNLPSAGKGTEERMSARRFA
jgi:hypothetical protein